MLSAHLTSEILEDWGWINEKSQNYLKWLNLHLCKSFVGQSHETRDMVCYLCVFGGNVYHKWKKRDVWTNEHTWIVATTPNQRVPPSMMFLQNQNSRGKNASGRAIGMVDKHFLVFKYFKNKKNTKKMRLACSQICYFRGVTGDVFTQLS